MIERYEDEEEGMVRRYSIDVNKALENYRDIYECRIVRR